MLLIRSDLNRLVIRGLFKKYQDFIFNNYKNLIKFNDVSFKLFVSVRFASVPAIWPFLKALWNCSEIKALRSAVAFALISSTSRNRCSFERKF